MLKKRIYYTLKEKKFLKDGKFIPSFKKILYICTQDDLMQFSYSENSEIIIFWDKSNNAKFYCETEEDIDVKQEECQVKIINSSK